MAQRDRLKDLIVAFCNVNESRTFALHDLNDYYGDYHSIGIGGKTPQATVRRLLQELRDEGFISFLEKSGHYTLRGIDLLDKEKQDLCAIDISREKPQKKEYLLETYVRDVRWARMARECFGDHCLVGECKNIFVKEDGTPYIEVHHIVPLCRGGEDALWNMSVLCAHHHRMAHFANIETRNMMESQLLEIIGRML
jgi:predicted HNH restriction endonuclease